MNPGEAIGWIALGGMVLLMIFVAFETQRQLEDQANRRVIYLDELPTSVQLFGLGVFQVIFFRQSGNVHAERVVHGDSRDALRVIMQTFRRAKIEAVAVTHDTPFELEVWRAFHNHRGRAEGKRVGGAKVSILHLAGGISVEQVRREWELERRQGPHR
jgi:hypothetical protein